MERKEFAIRVAIVAAIVCAAYVLVVRVEAATARGTDWSMCILNNISKAKSDVAAKAIIGSCNRLH